MAFVAAKCTQCLAGITVDDSQSSGTCGFCGCVFITKTAIDSNNSGISTESQVQAQQAHQPLTSAQQTDNAPPRPTINVAIAVVGLLFWPCSVAYIAYKVHQQRKWDQQYKR